MISVYNKKSMKRKEMIGFFSLGCQSTGEEENAHWNEMRDSKGEQVSFSTTMYTALIILIFFSPNFSINLDMSLAFFI